MIILQFLSEHGLDTLLIALVTVILTGLLKMPIKKLASKSAKCKKITRFITFMPLFIGFGLTVLMSYLINSIVTFDETFFAQWLSSVSLSLAIYAFWEKFVPSEKKILSEAEINANKAVVEELRNTLLNNDVPETANVAETAVTEVVVQSNEVSEVGQAINHRKIILTNNKK